MKNIAIATFAILIGAISCLIVCCFYLFLKGDLMSLISISGNIFTELILLIGFVGVIAAILAKKK